MLGRWCKEYRTSPGQAFRGPGVSWDEEVPAPKRDLAWVRKEREFLAEAAAFFAKESK